MIMMRRPQPANRTPHVYVSTSVRLQTHSVYGGHVGRRSDLYIAAEAERQFSTAGKIITPARAMLDPVWLRINSFIRLNMNMVVDATN